MARRLREEVEILQDARPSADGVDDHAPGADEWGRTTVEERPSAARGAPAAGDVRVGLAGDQDGVCVNPPPAAFAWESMEGAVPTASHKVFL